MLSDMPVLRELASAGEDHSSQLIFKSNWADISVSDFAVIAEFPNECLYLVLVLVLMNILRKKHCTFSFSSKLKLLLKPCPFFFFFFLIPLYLWKKILGFQPTPPPVNTIDHLTCDGVELIASHRKHHCTDSLVCSSLQDLGGWSSVW